jgi:hypothetical protein
MEVETQSAILLDTSKKVCALVHTTKLVNDQAFLLVVEN